MMAQLKLEPHTGVGDFKLGSEIRLYLPGYSFKFFEADKVTNYAIYELEKLGLDLYVENGIIKTIVCNKECYYGDKNIIGMNIQDFIKTYHLKPDRHEKLWVSEDEQQTVYEFDPLDMMLWTDEKGKIVTVQVLND